MQETEAATARVSEDGAIEIPKEIRDQLGMTEGTEVSIRIEGDEIVVTRKPGDWRKWRGFFKGLPLLEDLAEERRKELEKDARWLKSNDESS